MVTHIVTVFILLLSGGFAFPVLNLFMLHVRNFMAGQTSIERLGKQQGKKVALAQRFNVNEPLLRGVKPDQIETRFFYRQAILDAQT